MSDDPTRLTDRLERLAPQVDAAAGRDLFERRRSGGGVPRWLMPAAAAVLVVAGVAGLWAVNRSDDSTPVAGPGTGLVNGPLTEGDGYETVFVGEVSHTFGEARLAVSDDEYAAAWDELGADVDAPAVDLERTAVLVTTRPDNACADTIVRFDIDNGMPIPTWTPVFDDLTSACNDPLLSWVYVVALDRALLGTERAIRVPAAPLYDVDEVMLIYRSGDQVADDDPVPAVYELTETDLRVPRPEVGTPTLQSTSFGLLWVVAHEEGNVSVLPATIDARVDEDTGVDGLAQMVLVADDGESFAAGGFTWDAHGRALNGGRANDLVGYAGLADGDEVEVFVSDATRVAGSPAASPNAGGDYATATDEALAALWGDPIDTKTFFTLSSSGPIWRYFDATLVVEDGVGAICEVPDDVSVPDLTTCGGDDAGALKTTVTSTNPDITTWFHGPILAWQDPMAGAFTQVVPLGGTSSRNDTVDDGAQVEVIETAVECLDESLTFIVQVETTGPVEFEYVVLDGEVELATGGGVAEEAASFGVGTRLLAPPGPDALLLMSYGSTDLEIPLDIADLPDCGAVGADV